DRALARLNEELAALTESLSMERQARADALAELGDISASLASRTGENERLRTTLDATSAELLDAKVTLDERETELARLIADVNALNALKQELESEVASRLAQLEENRDKLTVQTELSAQAAAQAELLNRQMAALREQLAAISEALAIAEATNRDREIEIEDLGRQLNVALADRVG